MIVSQPVVYPFLVHQKLNFISLERKKIFSSVKSLKKVTKLDSDGEDKDRRRTLMLTPMCCWGGLFLLSYLFLLIKMVLIISE